MQGAKTSIVFTFPHFNETLLYDPTAGLEEPVSALGASGGGPLSPALTGRGRSEVQRGHRSTIRPQGLPLNGPEHGAILR